MTSKDGTPTIFDVFCGEVNYAVPTAGMINWGAVAYGLSGVHRFAAQCPMRINVAAHSLFVEAELKARGYDHWTRLLGLVHDASEAYTGDMPAPLKKLLPEFKTRIERPMMEAIMEHLLDWTCGKDGKFISRPGYFAGVLDVQTAANSLKPDDRHSGNKRFVQIMTTQINMPVIKEVDMLSRECERKLSNFYTDQWPIDNSVKVHPDSVMLLALNSRNAAKQWRDMFCYLVESISGRAVNVLLPVAKPADQT